jgi:hypothetical protein
VLISLESELDGAVRGSIGLIAIGTANPFSWPGLRVGSHCGPTSIEIATLPGRQTTEMQDVVTETDEETRRRGKRLRLDKEETNGLYPNPL